MKKILYFLLTLILMMPVSVAGAATLNPDPNVSVFLNGQKLSFDINPIQAQGTTLVQFTTIFKALGLQYSWDQETKTVYGFNNDLQIRLMLNDPIANVNGYNIKLHAAPIAYQGKTLVPLRFVSEATGMKVTWKASSKTITIESDQSSNQIAEPSLLYYMAGASAGDTPALVKSRFTTEPAHPYGKDIYTYYNMDFLSYNSELNFDFVYNELTAVSYYFGKDEFEDHYFVVYSDILEDLATTFGVPNDYSIYENEYDAGYDAGTVDWDMPIQLLYEGIEEGEYRVEALWNLPQAVITLILYTTVDGNVLIEMAIAPL